MNCFREWNDRRKVGRAVPSAPLKFSQTNEFKRALNSHGALGTACPTFIRFGQGAIACLDSRSGAAAYTLTEVIVSAGLFSLVVLGFVAAYLASLEFTEFVRPKVQNANTVMIGTGSITSFTAAGVGKPQAGNAIRICPTTNLNQYIYYFADTTNQVFMKVPLNSSNTAVMTIATCITNKTPFVM